MQCPSCNFLNDATSPVCVQCRTTIIHEAVGHSAAYLSAERRLDARMYGGAGALLGFLATAALLKFVLTELWETDQQLLNYSSVGAVGGGVLGRLVLQVKRRAV